MSSAVCTFLEGHYHYGAGALINSLYQHGFRGVVWVGYRGELPFWAKNSKACDNFLELAVADDCMVRFVSITAQMHLANYKPTFMLDLWEHYCPESDYLYFFDPDIVIKCRWSFFEDWIGHGIGLCQDAINTQMPANHPTRLVWQDYAKSKGYSVINQINQYFNGGFIGLSRKYISALTVWQDLLHGLDEVGVSLMEFGHSDASQPFSHRDQDVLNILPMVSMHPFSTLGPDGMDFAPGGYIMSHAICTPKPWRKRMTAEALSGSAPSAADKGYWLNTQTPIRLYSAQYRLLKQIDLRCGAAIGRFIRHSY